jgi:2-iminobutanoate/2-iminopropanoate deaminase
MRKIVSSDKAPKAIGPYSQGVKAGGFVFFSGQIPLDPATGELMGVSAAEQTVQIMQNIAAVLEAAGLGFNDVVKTTIFLTDLADFAAVNEVYGGCFSSEPPARSTVQVSALPRGAKVEIEVVAFEQN